MRTPETGIPHNSLRAVLLMAVMSVAAAADVVDRIAVIVGNMVLTETEILQEVRLTQFLNQQPLDVSPAQRRAAAERLVDQQLIRNELEIGHYPQPDAAEGEELLRRFRQENYPNAAAFRAVLEKYGITENELKGRLMWQESAIRFTDLRFSAAAAAVNAPATGATQTANRMRAGAEPAAKPANSVDEQMDAWLKETRSRTRIQFKKEAFQ